MSVFGKKVAKLMRCQGELRFFSEYKSTLHSVLDPEGLSLIMLKPL